MISFIIPTYNDYKELNNILHAIDNCKLKHETIIIDDGSDVEISKKITNIVKPVNSKNNSNLKLLRNKNNLGKSKSMKKGIKNSHFDTVCFIDADLKGLTTNAICKLVEPVIRKEFDITMSRKEAGLSKLGNYGFQQNFTGERCFRKRILLDNIDIFDKTENYAVESEMNRRFYNKYRIAVVSWPNVSNPAKIRHGIKDGIKQDIKMNKEILKYLSKKELLSQIKTVRQFPVIR